jgi:hypothetical protein
MVFVLVYRVLCISRAGRRVFIAQFVFDNCWLVLELKGRGLKFSLVTEQRTPTNA